MSEMTPATPIDPKPGTAADALLRVPLFEGLPAAVIASLADQAELVSFAAGTEVLRQGDSSTDLFVVRTGRLAVFRTDKHGRQERQAEIFAGETVGEMAHLTGEPRSASVVALRDSELYRLRQKDLDELLVRAPALGVRVARILARRIARMQDRAAQRSRPRIFALLPHPSLADGGRAFARKLAASLGDFGPTIELNSSDGGIDAERFQMLEASRRQVLLLADRDANAWSAFCQRQADVHLFVAAAEAKASPWPSLLTAETLKNAAPERELILLRQPGAPLSVAEWTAVEPTASFIHHIETNADLSRLTRFLCRQALTLVLSGGGARGFAHLGAVKAIADAGLSVDAFGGSSMGALIAAAYAAGWPHETIVERFRDAFVTRRLLNDPMLPVVALFRGRRVDALLEATFGDMAIEDLRHPYFCVSTDLSRGRPSVHRRGLLRRWLRASVAVPGILRPVHDGSAFHVDGGVIDNLPVEEPCAWARGPVIGIDVGFDEGGDVSLSARPRAPLWQKWFGARADGEPSILELLWRVGTIGNAAQAQHQEENAIIIRPPIREVGFLDWRKLDRAMEIGYRHTAEIIAKKRLGLTASFGS